VSRRKPSRPSASCSAAACCRRPRWRRQADYADRTRRVAQARHGRLARAVEQRWRRRSATTSTGRPGLITGPRLAAGMRPHPDGWRGTRPIPGGTQAVLADPASLPHYPDGLAPRRHPGRQLGWCRHPRHRPPEHVPRTPTESPSEFGDRVEGHRRGHKDVDLDAAAAARQSF
jgi:hypothetical protein